MYSVVVSFFVLLLLFFIFIFSILDFCVIQACFCQFCYVLNLPSFAIMMSQIYLSISILIPTEAGLSILFSLIITYSGKHPTYGINISHNILFWYLPPLWACDVVLVCMLEHKRNKKKKIKCYSARARSCARFVFALVYLEASHVFLLTTFSWLRT